MASTYTPQNAIDLVRLYVKGIPVTSLDAETCDQINSIIWTRYPWSWSLAALTSTALVDDTQDYAGVTPTDFYRLVSVRLVRTDTTPDQPRELDIKTFLPPDLISRSHNTIGTVAWFPIGDLIRLESAVTINSPITVNIEGEYQQNPVKITDAALGTVFTFDDRYFPVFTAGLEWLFYKFADDARAGEVVTDSSGRVRYTGSMGTFYGLLDAMVESEGWGDKEPVQYPSDPLGVSNLGVSEYTTVFGR